MCIEALYALVGPRLVEKRVGADPVDDLQRQARPEMVLEIMKRAKGEEASTEWDSRLARALYLRDCATMGDWCVEIVEIERFGQLLEGEPVRDERFRRWRKRLAVAQVHLLPVVHGLTGGVMFARNVLGFLECGQELGQAVGPAALEVDVLCVGYQERSVEIREAQRGMTNSGSPMLRLTVWAI